MSPEEIERTMQFLRQQQAQFSAGLTKLSTKTDLIAEGLIGLTGIVGRLVEAQTHTDAQLKETADQLKETDQRLSGHINVVIEMFERHLRKDHGLEGNGGRGGEEGLG
jgi:hypothetical protein